MGRPKGSKNKIQSGITYPRQCTQCEYIANNPSMYHYHMRLHEYIPQNQLCDHGCGQLAKFKNTNGKYTCEEKYSKCPNYLKELSSRTAASWVNATNRKEETRIRFFEYCCGIPDVVEKIRKTKRKRFKYLSEEVQTEYRHYARYIRERAQRWAKEQGYKLGQQSYHVDHKFSIWDGFHAKIPESIMNHPANLQILDAKGNSSKGAKSSMSLEELMLLISKKNN